MMQAYLDYGAATPVAPEVLEAMLPYLTERFYNPSAPYALARTTRAELEAARAMLARLIGARPAAVTLTAGATEANNLAFAAVADNAHVVTDAAEHESVLACAEAREHTIVAVDRTGRVDPAAIAAAIRPDTELVSVEMANGEVGTIQPIRAIAAVVAAERARRLERAAAYASANATPGVPVGITPGIPAGTTPDSTPGVPVGTTTVTSAHLPPRPLYLHVDASQAALTHAVNVSSLGADLLTLSAAKLYGPKQVGLLWSSDDVRLRPLVRGGGQEGGVRSGTENVAGIVGFARALEQATAERKQAASRLQTLRNRLQSQLVAAFPTMVVSGPKRDKQRLPGLLHVSFPGLDAMRLVIGLERQGVSVGTGSACAASRMQVSHVLRAMGVPDEVARGSLRITLGLPTTQEEIDYAARAIEQVVRAESQRVGVSV